MPKSLSLIEAKDALDEGNRIVTCGGYTFIYDKSEDAFYYCAFGTWPSKLRQSPYIDLFTSPWDEMNWRELTTMEMILKYGWYVSHTTPYLNVVEGMLSREVGLGIRVPDLSLMEEHVRQGNYTPGQLLHPDTNRKIWKKFFVEQGWITELEACHY